MKPRKITECPERFFLKATIYIFSKSSYLPVSGQGGRLRLELMLAVQTIVTTIDMRSRITRRTSFIALTEDRHGNLNRDKSTYFITHF